jgi:hypothetical protein
MLPDRPSWLDIDCKSVLLTGFMLGAEIVAVKPLDVLCGFLLIVILESEPLEKLHVAA